MKYRRSELFVEDGFRRSRADGYWRVLLVQKLAFAAGRTTAFVELGEEPEEDTHQFYKADYDEATDEFDAMTTVFDLVIAKDELDPLGLALTELDLEQLGMLPTDIPSHLRDERDLRLGLYSNAPTLWMRVRRRVRFAVEQMKSTLLNLCRVNAQ